MSQWNRSIIAGDWRTIFRRLFLRKADWHEVLEGYETVTKWKALKSYKLQRRSDAPSVRCFNLRKLFNLVTFLHSRVQLCLFHAELEESAFTLFLICSAGIASESRLPFGTVFKGQDQFNRLVAKAKAENWKSLPIGDRTAAVGKALVGTRYKHFTLEIDNRIESPSVNFYGMDCWTFFEIGTRFRANAERTGIELDSGAFAALHRDGSISRRPMHGRLSFPAALPGRLALR